MIGLGTIINTVAVIAGGLIGHFAGGLFKKEQQEAPEEHYMAAEFTVTPQGEIEY